MARNDKKRKIFTFRIEFHEAKKVKKRNKKLLTRRKNCDSMNELPQAVTKIK